MNVDKIFDSIQKASSYVHLQDKIYRKKIQIENILSKRCGNCFHWMKSSCMPEKKHKQFKSCDSFGCKDFAYSFNSTELYKKFKIELEKLNQE